MPRLNGSEDLRAGRLGNSGGRVGQAVVDDEDVEIRSIAQHSAHDAVDGGRLVEAGTTASDVERAATRVGVGPTLVRILAASGVSDLQDSGRGLRYASWKTPSPP